MTAIRLHSSSSGLNPTGLVAGRDLALSLPAGHGTDAPAGTYVFDFLDSTDRSAADRAALDALSGWRAHFDGPLTVEGVCWPFVWELPLYELLNPAVSRALGLRRALRELGATAVELADGNPGTEGLAAAIARDLGLPVRLAPGARQAAEVSRRPPRARSVRLARRRAIRTLTWLGAPSLLRRDSVALHAYWPLMPLLDRMLEDRGARPALFLDKRPTGVGRCLRIAVRGGLVGAPTRRDWRWAGRIATRMLAATRADVPVEVEGIDLGPWLCSHLERVVEARAARDLAQMAMLRRAFRSGRVRWVVGAYDLEPGARLIVLLAQEAGIRTLMLCHGAYLLPQPLSDLEVCDEVALWSYEVAPPITNWDRPIHEIGYPIPHDPPPPTRRVPALPPRIGVLGQLGVSSTCVLDERTTMRCYETPLRAIAGRFPGATVALRPHPAEERGVYPALVERFPELNLREEGGGDILAFHRSIDLCIGGASTATLQAALVGTPAVALNLSGSEWPFPLGGDSSVPVARSKQELEVILESWKHGGPLLGREELLKALGATGGDGPARLLAILEGQATSKHEQLSLHEAVSG